MNLEDFKPQLVGLPRWSFIKFLSAIIFDDNCWIHRILKDFYMHNSAAANLIFGCAGFSNYGWIFLFGVCEMGTVEEKVKGKWTRIRNYNDYNFRIK